MEFPELSKTKSSLYSRLGNVKVRRKEGLFMVVGEKCVADTRDAFEAEALIATPEWLYANRDSISFETGLWRPDLIRSASSSELAKISGMNSAPEVIAIYRIPDQSSVNLKLTEGELSLMLDGIQDPGNFGSILRTAEWFGITRIFASNDSADLFNPKVVQATMGAVSRVKVIYSDLTEVIVANPQIPVYGTLLDGKNIYRTELKGNALIVMGNEGKGITPEIRRLITHPILIPPFNPTSHGESLNVAAATAIVLSTFRFHS